MKIQKLTDAGSADTDVEPYLISSEWVMQQKFDGARVMMIHTKKDGFHWGDGTTQIKFSAALLKLPALEAEMQGLLNLVEPLRNFDGQLIFDGELIIESGEYHVFDVLSTYPDAPLHTRLALLRLLEWCERRLVQVVSTYRTEESKREFWKSIQEAGVEGAVSKRLDSTYAPGERSKYWLKHKLVKSCECLVTSVERTFKDNGIVSHGSAGLAVYTTEGKLIPIGNASLIGRDVTIREGSVVEVNYLFRQEGGYLVQPRIVRQRFDRLVGDCMESQIPAYSREAVR